MGLNVNQQSLFKTAAKGAVIGTGASIAAKPSFESEDIKQHAMAAAVGAGIGLVIEVIDGYTPDSK